MSGLFNQTEKKKKTVKAQLERRNAVEKIKDGIRQKQKKDTFEAMEKRNKRRKETQY